MAHGKTQDATEYQRDTEKNRKSGEYKFYSTSDDKNGRNADSVVSAQKNAVKETKAINQSVTATAGINQGQVRVSVKVLPSQTGSRDMLENEKSANVR